MGKSLRLGRFFAILITGVAGEIISTTLRR